MAGVCLRGSPASERQIEAVKLTPDIAHQPRRCEIQHPYSWLLFQQLPRDQPNLYCETSYPSSKLETGIGALGRKNRSRQTHGPTPPAQTERRRQGRLRVTDTGRKVARPFWARPEPHRQRRFERCTVRNGRFEGRGRTTISVRQPPCCQNACRDQQNSFSP